MRQNTILKNAVNGHIVETDFNDLYNEYSTVVYKHSNIPKVTEPYVVPVVAYGYTRREAVKNHHEAINNLPRT